jgi:hypothetical protein
MLHMLQWLYMHVSSLSPMFHLFLRLYCKGVYLDAAYVFTHILEVFYLNVVYVCNCFQVFLQLFQMHVSSVSTVFFYVASVASCFKNGLDVIHGIRVGSWRCAAWATFDGTGPCVAERCKHGRATYGQRGPMRGHGKTNMGRLDGR